MKQTFKKINLVIILFLSAVNLIAQEKVTISGVITDKISSESLIGVSIYIKEINSGTVSNEYGFYSLTLPKGNYTLNIGYLGYVSQDTLIQLEGSVKKNFSLLSNHQLLAEVVVNGDKNIAEIRRPEMSINKLSVREIKQMPVVLGEVDILK